MKKVLLFLLLLIVVGGMAFGFGFLYRQDEVDDYRRKVEADAAKIEGLTVAEMVTRKELSRTLSDNGALQAQVDELESKLDIEVEPQIQYKWRTNPINVDMERMLTEARQKLAELEAEGVDVSGIELPDIACVVPDPDFQVGGAEAHLTSKAGNWFAVGTVDVFGRIPPADFRHVGSASFDVAATEYHVASEDVGRKWRFSARLGATSAPGFDAGATLCLGDRRVCGYGGVQYDLDPLSVDGHDWYRSGGNSFSVSADRWRLYAGAEFTFGRQ